MYLHSALPADPQVSSSEETGHGVSGQVVDPALLSELGHDGIDPREPRPTLCPLRQRLGVVIPGDLHADGVSFHAVKVGVVGGRRIEKLSPQQLAEEREGGTGASPKLDNSERSNDFVSVYSLDVFGFHPIIKMLLLFICTLVILNLYDFLLQNTKGNILLIT